MPETQERTDESMRDMMLTALDTAAQIEEKPPTDEAGAPAEPAAPAEDSASTELPGWEEYVARYGDLPPEQLAVLRERFQHLTDSFHGRQGARIQQIERERDQYRQQVEQLMQRASPSLPPPGEPSTPEDEELAAMTPDERRRASRILAKLLAETDEGRALKAVPDLQRAAAALAYQQADVTMQQALDAKGATYAAIKDLWDIERPAFESVVRAHHYNYQHPVVQQYIQAKIAYLDAQLARAKSARPVPPRTGSERPSSMGNTRGTTAPTNLNTMAEMMDWAAQNVQ